MLVVTLLSTARISHSHVLDDIAGIIQIAQILRKMKFSDVKTYRRIGQEEDDLLAYPPKKFS